MEGATSYPFLPLPLPLGRCSGRTSLTPSRSTASTTTAPGTRCCGPSRCPPPYPPRPHRPPPTLSLPVCRCPPPFNFEGGSPGVTICGVWSRLNSGMRPTHPGGWEPALAGNLRNPDLTPPGGGGRAHSQKFLGISGARSQEKPILDTFGPVPACPNSPGHVETPLGWPDSPHPATNAESLDESK